MSEPTPAPAQHREMIGGIPFEQVGIGQDTARCCLCGAVVDVGYEIREHISRHEFSRLEEDL